MRLDTQKWVSQNSLKENYAYSGTFAQSKVYLNLMESAKSSTDLFRSVLSKSSLSSSEKNKGQSENILGSIYKYQCHSECQLYLISSITYVVKQHVSIPVKPLSKIERPITDYLHFSRVMIFSQGINRISEPFAISEVEWTAKV